MCGSGAKPGPEVCLAFAFQKLGRRLATMTSEAGISYFTAKKSWSLHGRFLGKIFLPVFFCAFLKDHWFLLKESSRGCSGFSAQDFAGLRIYYHMPLKFQFFLLFSPNRFPELFGSVWTVVPRPSCFGSVETVLLFYRKASRDALDVKTRRKDAMMALLINPSVSLHCLFRIIYNLAPVFTTCFHQPPWEVTV